MKPCHENISIWKLQHCALGNLTCQFIPGDSSFLWEMPILSWTRLIFLGLYHIVVHTDLGEIYGYLASTACLISFLLADLTLSPVHHAAIGIVHPSRGISVRMPRHIRCVPDRSPEDCSIATDVASMSRAQTKKMEVSSDGQVQVTSDRHQPRSAFCTYTLAGKFVANAAVAFHLFCKYQQVELKK